MTAEQLADQVLDQMLFQQELPCDGGGVLLLSVNRVVHPSHVVGGDAASQSLERSSRLRTFLKELRTHDRHRIVRRKVVFVIIQHNKSERGD